MKKTIIISIIILAIVSLRLCSKEKNFIYYSIQEGIARIEIIHVSTQWDLVYETIYELKEHEVKGFLEKLSEISYTIAVFGDPGTIDDESCIMIIYHSGEFDIISSKLILKYDTSKSEIGWDLFIMNKSNREKFNELIDGYQ